MYSILGCLVFACSNCWQRYQLIMMSIQLLIKALWIQILTQFFVRSFNTYTKEWNDKRVRPLSRKILGILGVPDLKKIAYNIQPHQNELIDILHLSDFTYVSVNRARILKLNYHWRGKSYCNVFLKTVLVVSIFEDTQHFEGRGRPFLAYRLTIFTPKTENEIVSF